jgi:hypothetical protein
MYNGFIKIFVFFCFFSGCGTFLISHEKRVVVFDEIVGLAIFHAILLGFMPHTGK